MDEWLEELFANSDLLRMGHCQRHADRNLGMGWLYYGLVRLVRTSTVVVIGSWRGFTPLVFGKALLDNVEGGTVVFIDPSLVDNFWRDPDQVSAYFRGYGVTNVVHHAMTTQEFVTTDAYRSLANVGLVFIDGYHTAEQAKIDHEAFAPLVAASGFVLFHDSCKFGVSNCYGPGRDYVRTVQRYIDTLKQDRGLQVFDLPFADGLTLVRRAGP